MIEAVALTQSRHLNRKTEAERKNLGQYFTGAPVADYMASLIKPIDAPIVRILDAGAGTGILTISAALHCLKMGKTKVHAVLYEIDDHTIALLKTNMQQLSDHFQKNKAQFTFEIRHKDFLLSRPDKTDSPFHISSINPPYFKYNSKTSPYKKATEDLFTGNPNIYASFMAVTSASMAFNGQMIAIVPRSFTNGLYFKGFRHYLNKTMSLEKLHIFRSRNRVFKALSVLQENIICSYIKRPQTACIEVRTSTGYEDLHQVETQLYSQKLLIDASNEHEIIRIPETPEDAKILQIVEEWPSSFQKNGYFISTGRVVEHRAQEYITNPTHNQNSIPLLRMHNVQAFQTVWSGKNKKDARFQLLNGYHKHISQNQTYILLKRFSSKDEKRRLVAGIHNPKNIQGKIIALENHLNYIGRADEKLNLIEAYGLATLFNSTFMDKYFRCISGSTQVNATEIRLLKLPNRETIHKIGNAFLKSSKTNQKHIDEIVALYLEVKKSAVP